MGIYISNTSYSALIMMNMIVKNTMNMIVKKKNTIKFFLIGQSLVVHACDLSPLDA